MADKLGIGDANKKWDKLKAELPRLIAAKCVSFFLDAFKKEGWTDGGFKRWRPRIAKGRKENGRNLLVKTGRLRREVNMQSMVKVQTWNRILFEVDLPYANIHNQGFTGAESVKAYKRKRTARVKVQSIRTRRSTTVSATVGEVEVKGHTRHMNMPQRKFMGRSKELNKIIVTLIQSEIDKCFKR